MYFAATTLFFGRELWVHNPEDDSTELVIDTSSGRSAREPENLTAVGGFLFFTAEDISSGRELWYHRWRSKKDVLVDLVRDITPGPTDPHGSSPPVNLTAVNDTLFFSANNSVEGYELWKVDSAGVPFGATPAAVQVLDIAFGPTGSAPEDLVDFNGTLFFTVFDASVSPGRRLWKQRRTLTGTTLASSSAIVNNTEAGSVHALVTVDKQLFFSGTTSGIDDAELFVTDGTGAGTMRVKDILPGFRGSNPAQLTKVFGVLFFRARDGTFADPPPSGEGATGTELWRSDGTLAGTRMVKDVFPTVLPPMLEGIVANSSVPQHLAAADGNLFFAAIDADSNVDGRSTPICG